MSDHRAPDRYSTLMGQPVRIMQPAGVPKRREDCQPFSFVLHSTDDPRSLKLQQKFVTGIERLSRPKRRRAARAI